MNADRVGELGPKDTRLCFECVGEAFLRAEIQKDGQDGVCSYCGGEGRTFSIGEMADRIELAFDQHFYRTATEPSGMEYAMIKEGDYDWERKGDPVGNVIEEYANIEPNPAEDIRRVLERRHFDMELARMGEEGPFDEDAHYAEAGVDDAESQAGWLNFERSVKTEARYFSRTAEWTLQSIFEGIAEHKTHDGRPIVVEAGPGKCIAAIYRARVFQSNEKLEDALKRPDREIGPPPPKTAVAGRMNPHGISVLYGATDPMIALAVQEWIYEPGLPPSAPIAVSESLDRIRKQAAEWHNGNANRLRTDYWSAHEWLHFLRSLPRGLGSERMRKLDETFHLTQRMNTEILDHWLLMAVRNQYQPAYPRLEEFLATVGRRTYFKPLYEELMKTDTGKRLARGIYARVRNGYHPIVQSTIDKIVSDVQDGPGQ